MSSLGGSGVRRSHRRSDRCGLAAKGIVALAMMLLLALPPRQANAEIFTAIAIAASVFSALISLGDTGADPYGEMTAHNLQHLQHVHERLSAHDEAFKAILERLDELPNEIRGEINDAFTKNTITNVRTDMGNILDDIKVLKTLRLIEVNSGAPKLTPIANAALRLHDLQRSVGNLRQSTDDIIVVDLIAARYVEEAVIAMQGGIEAKITWSQIRDNYARRLAQIFGELEHQNEKSLMNRYRNVMIDAKDDLEKWETEVDEMLTKISTSRDRISKVIIPPILKYGKTINEYWLRDRVDPIIRNLREANSLYEKNKERLKLACSYDTLRSLYGYLTRWSLHELFKLVPDPTLDPWANEFPNLKEFYKLSGPQIQNFPQLEIGEIRGDYEKYISIDKTRLRKGIGQLVADIKSIPYFAEYYSDKLIEPDNGQSGGEAVRGGHFSCKN